MRCTEYVNIEQCPTTNGCCFDCERVDGCSYRCAEYDEYEFGEDCLFAEVEDK